MSLSVTFHICIMYSEHIASPITLWFPLLFPLISFQNSPPPLYFHVSGNSFVSILYMLGRSGSVQFAGFFLWTPFLVLSLRALWLTLGSQIPSLSSPEG